MIKMDSKNILITGSGSGLGRGMAIRLASEGHNIILNGRTESKLVETNQMLKNYNVKTMIKVGDVSDSEFVHTMIKNIVDEFELLHVTINNAGITGQGGSIIQTSEKNMQLIMDINFKGTFLVSKYAARAMKRQKHLNPLQGKIINISSITGLELTPIYMNDPKLIQTVWSTVNKKPLLERVGTAEDVAGLISFLVSDDSNYITGQTISVCGGVVLH